MKQVAWYAGLVTVFFALGVLLGLNSGQLFIPFIDPTRVSRIDTWTVYGVRRENSYLQNAGEVQVVEDCTVDVGLRTELSLPHPAGYVKEVRAVYEKLPCDFKTYLRVQAIVNKPMRCTIDVSVRRTISGRLVEERRTNNTPPLDRLATFAQMAQECEV